MVPTAQVRTHRPPCKRARIRGSERSVRSVSEALFRLRAVTILGYVPGIIHACYIIFTRHENEGLDAIEDGRSPRVDVSLQ